MSLVPHPAAAFILVRKVSVRVDMVIPGYEVYYYNSRELSRDLIESYS
jgi:hypothetical protein